MSDVKKHGEIAAFIKENMKQTSDDPTNTKFQVPQESFMKYLSDGGITKDTVKQLAEMTTDYYNGALIAAKDVMVGDGKIERVSINTRTPNGVMSARVRQQMDTRKPTTGEAMTKYGVCSIKWDVRSKISRDIIKSAASEVEALVNKRK